MKEIVHQIQPTSNSCVSTCLAMILGVPAQDIIDEFHDHYIVNCGGIREYMQDKGVTFNRRYADGEDQSLEPGGLYCIAVPSLNIVGGMHYCLFDYRDVFDYHLYDPVKGREGKRYYIEPNGFPENELEEVLGGFVVEFKVVKAPTLEI